MTSRTPERRSPLSTVIIVLSCAWIALLSLFDLAMFIHNPSIYLDGDQVHYDGMARLLLTHHVYNYWLHSTPSAMSMPGYPLFVAFVYSISGLGSRRLALLWLAQFVLYLVSVYLLYRLGRKLHNRLLGAVMAALLASLPFVFNEPFRALTENLAIPAFLLYLNLLYEVYKRPVKVGWWSVLGLCLGVMALIRPGLAELGLVPLILLLRRTLPARQWGVVVAFLVCCAIPLVPWWIRNLVTFHQFILFDRGEAANTLLAGTYPGYTAGPPNLNLTGVNQMALAKQRIAHGFSHEPLKYLMWFTVWRFHYSFDQIYLPLFSSTIKSLKPLLVWYQRIAVWGSIVFTVFLLHRLHRTRRGFLMLLLYSNVILVIMLLPFHPEPRFAIYSVLLFGIVLIAGLFGLASSPPEDQDAR